MLPLLQGAFSCLEFAWHPENGTAGHDFAGIWNKEERLVDYRGTHQTKLQGERAAGIELCRRWRKLMGGNTQKTNASLIFLREGGFAKHVVL